MKKLIAMLLSMIMIMAMAMAMGMTAMAEDNSVDFDTDTDVMTFRTDLLMSETAVTAPTVDFTYTLTSSGVTLDDGSVILAGIISDADGTITAPTVTTETFSPNDSVDPTATGEQTLSKDVKVDFSNITWATTGIYHYTITAVDCSSVSGVVMDQEETREIYVYVLQDASTDEYYIANIIMTVGELDSTDVSADAANSDILTADAEKSEGFLNGYGIDPSTDPGDSTDPDAAHEDFTVTVEVDGNMADRNKDFTIALTSTDGIEDGAIFTVQKNDDTTFYIQWDKDNSKFVEVTYTAAAGETPASWTTGDDFTEFTLKDSETFTIYSVVDEMIFNTVMTAEDNYTIYSSIDGGTASTAQKLTRNNEIQQDGTDDNTHYIPTYNQAIPETGVILELLPFVLIVLFAGALITFRVAKSSRRRVR